MLHAVKPTDSGDPFETAAAAEQQARDAELIARQRASLSEMIAGRIRRAADARRTSGIEEVWREDEDLYNGIDNEAVTQDIAPREKRLRQRDDKPSAGKSRIVINITRPKTDAAVARMQKLLVPHDDKPWEIGPTPVPDLQRAIDENDQRQVTTADGAQVPAKDVAVALQQQAKEAAERMADHIEDWFVEGGVYGQLRQVIADAGRIGTGVLKGPVPCLRRDRKYVVNGNVAEITTVERIAPGSKAISAWNLLPDPSCGDNIHLGAYCVERDYLTGRSVRGLAKLPDYDAQALAEILAEGPRSAMLPGGDRHDRRTDGQVSPLDSDTFETFYYYGDIPPETLIAGGWNVKGLLDQHDDPEQFAGQIETAMQLASVPVVATVINDRIVRITLNPLETGDFPFDLFVWDAVEGQIWGRGMPHAMRPAARMLIGAVRALLENAGLAAGPQVIIDRERIEPANNRYEIVGRKLWYWSSSDEAKDVRQAMQVFSIESNQQQLSNIIGFALQMADQLTNFPMMMQGDQGAAPDTVGGMAMLQANALAPLEGRAKRFDDHLILPHLKRYYDWGMQDPDVPADAKGDMQVRARAATALIQRDLYAQVLPQLMPVVKDPAFKLSPERWVEQLLRSNKVDPTTIQLTDAEAEAQAQQAAQSQPQDPRVEAAQILASQRQEQAQALVADKQQQREFEAQEKAADRAHERAIADIEFQIQAMEFAGQKEITFEQLRAMLATKGAELRTKKELFAAERAFAVGEGEGRGL